MRPSTAPVSASLLVSGILFALSMAAFVPRMLAQDDARWAAKTEVSVPFLAETPRGELVGEVSTGDIRVVDNGMLITKVRRVERQRNMALRLLVLVDRSGSIGPDDEKELRLLTDVISNEFEAKRDVLEVWDFDEKLRLAGRWHGPAEGPLEIPVVEIRSQHTAMNDAVVELCHSIAHPDAEYRTVLLLISDGEDNDSRHALRDAIEAAQMADVRVYPVYLRVSWHWEGKDALEAMAQATGGKLLDARNQKKLARAMRQVSEELRQQFRVTYDVPNLGGIRRHSVQLLAMTKGLRFRAPLRYQTE